MNADQRPLHLLCREAHQNGQKVYAHLGACSVADALNAGLDGFEHGVFCTPELWDPLPGNANIPSILRLQTFDPRSSEVQRLAELVAMCGAAVVPTVTAISSVIGLLSVSWYDEHGIWDNYTPGLGEQLRCELLEQRATPQACTVMAANETVLERQAVYMQHIRKAGGRIFAGTDPSVPHVMGGENIVDEALALRSFGFTAAEVLCALTIRAAEETGTSSAVGSLSAGKDADFLLLEQNPLEDLRALRSIYRTVKNGIFYDPAVLRREVRGAIPLATAHKMADPQKTRSLQIKSQ